MRAHPVSLILASLLGGLAIHGLFVACSGQGARPANGQSACKQWAFVIPDLSNTEAFPYTGPALVPGGPPMQVAPDDWEPIGYSDFRGTGVLFRRCAR